VGDVVPVRIGAFLTGPRARYRKWPGRWSRTTGNFASADHPYSKAFPGTRFLVDSAGFTLLEVLIALMLLFIVVVASYDLYYYSIVTWWRTSERQDTADHLRVAADRLARELRTAVQLTENSSETELWFRDAEGQVVRYYHDAAKKQLLRVRAGGTNPVASRVAAVGFTYAPAGLPRTQQRLVTITLVGDTGAGHYRVSTTVRLRVPR